MNDWAKRFAELPERVQVAIFDHAKTACPTCSLRGVPQSWAVTAHEAAQDDPVILQPVVPEDGDPAPDVGPDPVVLPQADKLDPRCPDCDHPMSVHRKIGAQDCTYRLCSCSPGTESGLSKPCRHTEHAIRGDGRVGRWFPNPRRGGEGLWERCDEPVVLPRVAVCNNWERWTEDE